MDIAEEKELDLVKISPNANPPVCKIMNYGKYVFELAKKEKEAKRNQKMVEIKEVWLSMTIDVGDLNVKARQAQKFLSGGNKVKVSIRMKGRQNAHANLGIEVMNKFFALVKDVGVMEKRPLTEDGASGVACASRLNITIIFRREAGSDNRKNTGGLNHAENEDQKCCEKAF